MIFETNKCKLVNIRFVSTAMEYTLYVCSLCVYNLNSKMHTYTGCIRGCGRAIGIFLHWFEMSFRMFSGVLGVETRFVMTVTSCVEYTQSTLKGIGIFLHLTT